MENGNDQGGIEDSEAKACRANLMFNLGPYQQVSGGLSGPVVVVGSVEGGKEIFLANDIPVHAPGEGAAFLNQGFGLGISLGEVLKNGVGGLSGNPVLNDVASGSINFQQAFQIGLTEHTVQMGVIGHDDIGRQGRTGQGSDESQASANTAYHA